MITLSGASTHRQAPDLVATTSSHNYTQSISSYPSLNTRNDKRAPVRAPRHRAAAANHNSGCGSGPSTPSNQSPRRVRHSKGTTLPLPAPPFCEKPPFLPLGYLTSPCSCTVSRTLPAVCCFLVIATKLFYLKRSTDGFARDPFYRSA